jgi:hypothetical protein
LPRARRLDRIQFQSNDPDWQEAEKTVRTIAQLNGMTPSPI